VAKAKPRLLLRSALVQNSSLIPSVQNGMGAFLRRDRRLITEGERAKIGDSLDLDAALEAAFPNANRWDYIFSVADAGKLLALEPHHATDSEISVVIAKKTHAAQELRGHLHAQHKVSEWLWVSHGRTSFSKMERATRRLAQAGIRYVGRSLADLGQ
jgi:hypothetical protein